MKSKPSPKIVSKLTVKATKKPVTKPVAKKATAKKVVIKKATIMPMSDETSTPYKEPNRISIEKANNGYIIQKGYGQGSHIAKDMKEVNAVATKLLK